MRACPHGTRRNFELDGFTWWECPACGEAGELEAPTGTFAGDLAQLRAATTNLKENFMRGFLRMSVPIFGWLRFVAYWPVGRKEGGRRAERRHRRRW